MLSRHLVHSSAIEGLDQTLYKGSESAAQADNKKATKSYFLRQCEKQKVSTAAGVQQNVTH